jgi:hypothetical protein
MKIHLSDFAFSNVNRDMARLISVFLQVFFAISVKRFPSVLSKICIDHI